MLSVILLGFYDLSHKIQIKIHTSLLFQQEMCKKKKVVWINCKALYVEKIMFHVKMELL